jgi:hypothetical protein
MSQIGQLPSIIMVPTNAVLAKHLSARRTPEAQAAGAGLGTTGSGSVGGGSIDSGKEGSSSGPGVPLEQLVDEFNSTVDSLMLLRRHCEPLRLSWSPMELEGDAQSINQCYICSNEMLVCLVQRD